MSIGTFDDAVTALAPSAVTLMLLKIGRSPSRAAALSSPCWPCYVLLIANEKVTKLVGSLRPIFLDSLRRPIKLLQSSLIT